MNKLRAAGAVAAVILIAATLQGCSSDGYCQGEGKDIRCHDDAPTYQPLQEPQSLDSPLDGQ